MPAKEPEPDDPLELTGVMLAVPDETSLKDMAACFVEEFLRDGWSDEQLRAMFRNPHYRGPYLVWRKMGEAFIEEVLKEVRRLWRPTGTGAPQP